MTDELGYETEREHGEARVRISGELDMNGTMRLEQELERLVQDEPERLVIDLSGVTFIDSTGINLLIAAADETTERGIELRLLPAPPEVMRPFVTTGLIDVLPFESER